MPNLALRNIPDQLHQELRSAAARNHRSLNGEILARLTESLRGDPIDPESLLRRIRSRHGTFANPDLSDEVILEMRNAGRP